MADKMEYYHTACHGAIGRNNMECLASVADTYSCGVRRVWRCHRDKLLCPPGSVFILLTMHTAILLWCTINPAQNSITAGELRSSISSRSI